jgi:hypothetical protein
MRRQRVVKLTLAAGMVGLLILPALVYTQVTGRVLNPRLRQTYTDLSSAVAAAAANDTLLVSGTLTDGDAILDSGTDTPPAGLKIVAGRGLRGTLQVSAAACGGTTNGAILDVSGRLGALTIQGLRLVVPNGCVGVYSDGTASGGNPLTVRGLRIDRAAGAIIGIFLDDETDGPFTIEQNVIPSVGGFGIWVDGDTATAITASVKGNTVGSAGSPTFFGILVTDVPATSSVTVERNRVDGGNNASSTAGIVVGGSTGVIVRRNTVRNFVGTAAAQDAAGIVIDESPNAQVLRNVIANNDTGVVVDDNTTPGTETADTVVINDNNITSTVANATGLLFIPDSTAATAPLDATNNWWGAANGPRDDDADTTDCPEATPPGCTTPPTAEGGGLPVAVGPSVANDCGTTAGTVTTCPFRTAPVSPAGA